jgi:hypothetical protein
MRLAGDGVRTLGLLLLAATAGICNNSAIAEPTAPTQAPAFDSCKAATLPLGAPAPLWERSLLEINRCQQDVPYLAAAAQWLNEQQQYEEGLLYAERALLLDPAHVPAWIEFALSQTALGAPEAGLNALLQAKDQATVQLATTLDGRTEGPNHAVQIARLTRWVAEIDHLLRSQSQPVSDEPTRALNAFVGYDSNFYGGPSSSQLELTLPTGPVLLAVPAGLEPQKGPFTGLQITQSGAIQDSPLWRYNLQAQAKTLFNRLSERAVSFQGNAERFDRVTRGQFASAGVAASYLGSKLVISQVQGAVGHETVAPWDCQLRLGAEAQLRHYPQSAGLDGNYLGLLQEGVCPNGWNWQARLGQDRPKKPAERAGGIQYQFGLQLGKGFQLDNQKALKTQLNLWRQTDQMGYSALLSNNAPRRINRGTLRLEYQWNLKKPSVHYLAFEQTLQRSNLTLFKSENTVIKYGIRGLW